MKRSALAPPLARRAAWLMIVLGAFLIGQSLPGGPWSIQQRLLGILAVGDGFLLFFAASLGFRLAVMLLALYLAQESFREWRSGLELINLMLVVRVILVGGILLLAWSGASQAKPPAPPKKVL